MRPSLFHLLLEGLGRGVSSKKAVIGTLRASASRCNFSTLILLMPRSYFCTC